MVQKISNYIRQYQIIKPQDRILAGVSGGADSVCLFLVLCHLQEELDFELEVMHVEHGIRGEASENDARFTEELCQKYNVPCIVRHVDVLTYSRENGLGHEEAARILRYNEFVCRAKKIGAKIALAHHEDDNAETVLFQMIRGSGLHGVTGIKPIRIEEDVCYIRPLLCVSRLEIEEYLDKCKQEFCIDVTNESVEYDRNKIRHIIIPELTRINSKAVSHINNTARRLSLIEDYISMQIKAAVETTLSKENDKYIIEIDKLMSLHEAIRNECVLEIIGMAAGRKKDIGEPHVRAVLELATAQSGKRINLPYSLEVYKEYQRLIIVRVPGSIDYDTELNNCNYYISPLVLQEIRTSGKTHKIDIGNAGESVAFRVISFDGDLEKIPKKAYTKWLSYDKIKDGFLVRKRDSGDYFISDSMGHRKKLKDFFINEKVPASKRNDVWLLAQNQEIALILGYRLGETYKVSENTKDVLEVRYNGGENSNGFFKEV